MKTLTANKAKAHYGLDTLPACVLVDGPQEADDYGTPQWTVCFGDVAGEVIYHKHALWFCDSRESASSLGVTLANRYNLELVNEAMHA